MTLKIEVTIDVIIHATEDITKFFESFNELFGLKEDQFEIQHVTGHFENPITMLKTKIVKKQAKAFMEKFAELLNPKDMNEVFQDIESKISDSTLHLRLDKQALIQKRIILKDGDSVKLKVQTPIYNKKDTIDTFKQVFQRAN